MTTILLLSALGAIISAIIGTFWYSPITPMGRIHMKSIGMDTLSPEEQKQKIEAAKPTMWKLYLAQIILSFLTAFSVVFTITESVVSGVPFKIAILFPIMNWLCFMVPVVGSAILWSSNLTKGLAWKKFFSDICSYLITILIIAYVVNLFV